MRITALAFEGICNHYLLFCVALYGNRNEIEILGAYYSELTSEMAASLNPADRDPNTAFSLWFPFPCAPAFNAQTY